ncbi:Os06g0118525 [Oryza sativa Japonica Group]|uniref:Os06g0118525 protein n=1 Tax=Oryza sativa subsp. japonica TaxID=39947 RepID=C7J406_ORYSJ|nr:hypothetical protein DAI22_06g011500 [Oryza sativa Japonica Group]BAH93300.1 Os06g0118525 [Oryza sativa Japonica Group]|eukprot:NP_001174572.1 Os06g0118525 [Oryza sativa Japonica Group]
MFSPARRRRARRRRAIVLSSCQVAIRHLRQVAGTASSFVVSSSRHPPSCRQQPGALSLPRPHASTRIGDGNPVHVISPVVPQLRLVVNRNSVLAGCCGSGCRHPHRCASQGQPSSLYALIRRIKLTSRRPTPVARRACHPSSSSQVVTCLPLVAVSTCHCLLPPLVVAATADSRSFSLECCCL